MFSELIAALQSGLPQAAERESLVAIVEEMRNEAGKDKFKEKYQRFITAAANHMTIIAPFLPALTHLL